MEQQNEMLPPTQPMDVDSAPKPIATSTTPQFTAIEQHRKMLPPAQVREMGSAPEFATRCMMPQIPATGQQSGMLTSIQPMEMNSASQSVTQAMAPQMPGIAQYPKIPFPQQTLGMKSTPRPTTKPKAFATRADWVNTFWADISGQLRRLAVISDDLFDGLLLRRDTVTGSWIFRELVGVLCFAPNFGLAYPRG